MFFYNCIILCGKYKTVTFLLISYIYFWICRNEIAYLKNFTKSSVGNMLSLNYCCAILIYYFDYLKLLYKVCNSSVKPFACSVFVTLIMTNHMSIYNMVAMGKKFSNSRWRNMVYYCRYIVGYRFLLLWWAYILCPLQWIFSLFPFRRLNKNGRPQVTFTRSSVYLNVILSGVF